MWALFLAQSENLLSPAQQPLPTEKAEAQSSNLHGWPWTGVGLLLKQRFLCCSSICVELVSWFLCQAAWGRKYAAPSSKVLYVLSKLLSVCFLPIPLLTLYIYLQSPKGPMNFTGNTIKNSYFLKPWLNPTIKNCISISQDFCDSPLTESNCTLMDH